jgi:hypothetical protein
VRVVNGQSAEVLSWQHGAMLSHNVTLAMEKGGDQNQNIITSTASSSVKHASSHPGMVHITVSNLDGSHQTVSIHLKQSLKDVYQYSTM